MHQSGSFFTFQEPAGKATNGTQHTKQVVSELSFHLNQRAKPSGIVLCPNVGSFLSDSRILLVRTSTVFFFFFSKPQFLENVGCF